VARELNCPASEFLRQEAICDGLLFDFFPFDQIGLTAPEVDVGWGKSRSKKNGFMSNGLA